MHWESSVDALLSRHVGGSIGIAVGGRASLDSFASNQPDASNAGPRRSLRPWLLEIFTRSRRRCPSLLLLVTALVPLDCRGTTSARPWFDVAVANCSPEKLEDVSLSLGPERLELGVVVPGAEVIWADASNVLAERATLSWRSTKRAATSETVDLGMALPADFGADQLVFQVCPSQEVEVFARARPGAGYSPLGTWRNPVQRHGRCCADRAASPPP